MTAAAGAGTAAPFAGGNRFPCLSVGMAVLRIRASDAFAPFPGTDNIRQRQTKSGGNDHTNNNINHTKLLL